MTHPISIKNCGLKHKDEIDVALHSGAHFLGFVHYPPSPRHLPLTSIASLASYSHGKARNVLVTVKPEEALLHEVSALACIDYIQLHGIHSEASLLHIKTQTNKPLILGLGIANVNDIETAKTLAPLVDYLLFDYKTPSHGGSGQAFDWRMLHGHVFARPWFLAGGLSAETVADALSQTRATMVDVSSGLEDAPGKKSLKKIAAFNRAVLQAGA